MSREVFELEVASSETGLTPGGGLERYRWLTLSKLSGVTFRSRSGVEVANAAEHTALVASDRSLPPT